MSDSKRVMLWDNLKFVLILLVVIGHCIEPMAGKITLCKGLFLFIYSFHMPLFIFIAGYFHKNINIIKKMYFYLALSVLLKGIFWGETLLFEGKGHFSLFVESGLPWFMFAIACFIGMSYVLREIDYGLLLFMAVFTSCLAGYDRTVQDFLVLSRILVYFPFYIVGIIVKKRYRLWTENTNRKRRILSCIIIIIWLMICLTLTNQVYFLRPFFTGRNPFPASLYFWGAVIRLLCYMITFIVCFSLIAIIPRNQRSIISNWGSNTLQVYFWHMVILKALFYFGLLKLPMIKTFSGCFLIGLAVILTVLLNNSIFSMPLLRIKMLCFNETIDDKG